MEHFERRHRELSESLYINAKPNFLKYNVYTNPTNVFLNDNYNGDIPVYWAISLARFSAKPILVLRPVPTAVPPAMLYL